jgi:Type VI secretion system (T6SS), amidase effector protein 4
MTTTILLLSSCKKTDVKDLDKISFTKDLTPTFFKLPTNAAFAVKRVAQELERQNNITGFVKNFAANEGLPIWDKVIINEYNTQNIVSSSGDTSVIIPYAIQNAEEIKGYIKAKLNGNVILYLNRASDYIGYSFTQDVNATGKTAVKYALAMMNVNSKTFGENDYTITDPQLNTAFHPNEAQGNELSLSLAAEEQICYHMRNNFIPDPNIRCITISTGYWPELAGSNNDGPPLTPPTQGGAAPDPDPCGNKQIVNGNLPAGCGGSQNGWEPDSEPDATPLIQHLEGLEYFSSDPNKWNNQTFPPQALPTWNDYFNNYPKDTITGCELESKKVYEMAGGPLYAASLSSPLQYENACAVRNSIALNKCGKIIPSITMTEPDGTVRQVTRLGANGLYYFIAASDLYWYMRKTFGTPPADNVVIRSEALDGNFASKLPSDKKGIYIMKARNPSNSTGFGATGHATAFKDGSASPCNGHLYGEDSLVGGGISSVSLWVLN